MAQNKNALIRYRTIDKCLQNNYRHWTLEDLIEACSEALYEYEGRDVQVSKRTVQLDIQLMRSEKLGYCAPIEVYDKKYYRYADDSFTITDIPLNETDMHVLSETVEVLKQFKDFSLFSELGGIIQRLEDKIYVEKNHQPAIIHLDRNEYLKGLHFLDLLYQAILKKIVVVIKYQSFKAPEPTDIIFHPFILKEYNNRWFLVGKKATNSGILTLALDRMVTIDFDTRTEHLNEYFDGDDFYKNTIGVTVLNDERLETVIFKADPLNAQYILTKPLHHSQRILEWLDDESIIFEMTVHHNLEFERTILGFGPSVEVLSPSNVRRRFKRLLKLASEKYV